MGAFNTVVVELPCPVCENSAEFEIQFKYGNTWQFEYRIGNRIKWGGNEIGEPGHETVLVGGIGGPCSCCGIDTLEFDLVVKSDVIVDVLPVGLERVNSNELGYVVLDG